MNYSWRHLCFVLHILHGINVQSHVNCHKTLTAPWYLEQTLGRRATKRRDSKTLEENIPYSGNETMEWKIKHVDTRRSNYNTRMNCNHSYPEQKKKNFGNDKPHGHAREVLLSVLSYYFLPLFSNKDITFEENLYGNTTDSITCVATADVYILSVSAAVSFSDALLEPSACMKLFRNGKILLLFCNQDQWNQPVSIHLNITFCMSMSPLRIQSYEIHTSWEQYSAPFSLLPYMTNLLFRRVLDYRSNNRN